MNAFEKLINDIPSMSNEELAEILDHIGHLEYERAVLDEVKKRLVVSDTNKLEKAKRIIKANIKDARCGIFDCRNVAGDTMETIYDEDGLIIDICRGWMYFEVFGLTAEEFNKLEEFYDSIKFTED